MIPAFLLPLAARLSPVGKVLKSIPRPVWIAIGVVALLLLGSCVHHRKVKAFGEERYAAGVKAEGDRIAAKAEKIAKRAAEISANARKLNNETNRRIAADARTVLLRGPGKASCLNPATPAAGRRIAPAGKASPAVDQVPDGEGQQLIGLPFAGAVTLTEEHDLCIAEAETWRAWHKQLEEAWKRSN